MKISRLLDLDPSGHLTVHAFPLSTVSKMSSVCLTWSQAINRPSLSQTSGLATWSADSSMFVYTDIDTNEFGLHTRIHAANITLNNITTIFGDKDDRDFHYGALAWSPTVMILCWVYGQMQIIPGNPCY